MKRHLPLGIALAALLVSLLANPSVTATAQSAVAKISGKKLKNGSVAEKKLQASVRAKLNAPDQTLAGAAAGGVLDGTYPQPGLADGAVTGADVAADTLTGAHVAPDTLTGADVAEGTLATVPDAASLGGTAASAYQQKCQTGVLKASATLTLANVSPTSYSIQGVGNAYMCIPGTIYAKRPSTGTVDIAFHPDGQTGLFGGLLGAYPMVVPNATGAGYMANISSGNPGDPPPTYTSIITYRVRVVDHEDTAVNQSVRVLIF
ncbi:hypothetical protein [Nocardioides dilutus]